MDNNSYWFYLDPYVHISIKANNLLLYNLLNKKAIIQYNTNIELLRLVKKFMDSKNMYVIKLYDKNLHSPEIINFIKQVKKYYMGDILDSSYSKIKPVQLMPLLSIQSEKPSSTFLGKDILKSFMEVSIYINNQSCYEQPVFVNGYRQFLFCRNSKKKYKELELAKIAKFLSESKGSSLSNINILGGNIFSYSKFSELVKVLNDFLSTKTYYFYYLDFKKHKNKLKILKDKNSEFNVLISWPICESEIVFIVKTIKKLKIKTTFTFILEKESHIKKTEKIISDLAIEHYLLKPYYAGGSLTFFKKNVFITKQELLQSKIKQKDIHAKMAVNPFQFGKITILNNGNIYANVNGPRLGILNKDSLYDIIYKEMTCGKSWMRLRTKVKPCRNCIFNLLCPPLSNYEYALGRNNLCHIL